MAKNDYFVLVYYILKYLYHCLKNDEDIKVGIVMLEEYPVYIEESYAAYVLKSMQEEGYIKGVDIINVSSLGVGKKSMIKSVNNIEITPKGIEFLLENSLMTKAYESLKKFKEAIPFI